MAELEAKAKGRGKAKLIIIILVSVIVLTAGGGGAAWFLLKPKPQPTPAQIAAEREKNMRFISMEPFVTNLQSEDGSAHYLQLRIDLKTYDAHAEEKVKRMTPEIRNSILRILAAQSADKVGSVEARDRLRQEILAAINKLLADGAPADSHSAPGVHAAQGAGAGPIAGVYFTAFVVQ